MIDITADLAAVASALDAGPTPGRWLHLPGDRFVYDRMEDGCRGLPVVGVGNTPSFFGQDARNLGYIAACHPARMARILADHARLTSEVEALRVDADRWRWFAAGLRDQAPKLAASIDAARAAVAKG